MGEWENGTGERETGNRKRETGKRQTGNGKRGTGNEEKKKTLYRASVQNHSDMKLFLQGK